MKPIGHDYAEALFLIARERDCVSEFLAETELIDGILRDFPDYIGLLSSPALSMEERLSNLEEAFGKSLSEPVLSLCKLLCEKGHVSCFPELYRHFSELARLLQNRITATVFYAAMPDEAQKERIASALSRKTGKNVETVYQEDRSLIGGIKIQIGDTVYDGSIAARLNAIKGVIGS
ncbi:MAG: ATP synthase F1 subunit delta [Clostridia bacterium]|nr:ATP synthase F1 subunit delta [Clostridia bacterium]